MDERHYISDWWHYQHYSDRSPAWIKLHRSQTLDCERFDRLPDSQKAAWLLLCVLASSGDGSYPADPVYLRRKLGLEATPDLDLFISLGLASKTASTKPLIASKSLATIASTTQAARKQNAIEREEREKREKKKGHADAWDLFRCALRDQKMPDGYPMVVDWINHKGGLDLIGQKPSREIDFWRKDFDAFAEVFAK